jgi:hypothetical protein
MLFIIMVCLTVEYASSQSEVDALQTDIKVEEYDPVFSGSVSPGPYGKGYPRGKKTAAGRLTCGRATPRRAYKGWAWQGRVKL